MRTMWAGAAALALGAAWAAAEEEKVAWDQLPAVVRDAVKAKFPAAEVVGAEKETDKGKTRFEVNLKQNGKKIDLALSDTGEILEVEKEIAVGEVPADVLAALHAKHPGATVKSAEDIAKGGKNHYELIVATAAGKTVEVVVEARWTITKEEEKKPGDKG